MNNDMPVSAFNRVNGSNGSSLWTPTSASSSVHTPFILAPPPAGTASHGHHQQHNNNSATSTTTNNGTSTGSPMKVPVKPPPLKSLPPLSGYGGGPTVPLSPSGLAASMADRLPHLTLPFSPDILWRYPTQFSALTSSSPASGGGNSSSAGHHHSHHSQQPSSPHLDVKTHLPGALGPDPRTWGREDVLTFLRWCEREFDLPGLDLDKFQMNGKALCLLNKSDIAERAPGSGDVVHNALQLLLRDAPYTGRVPSSPLTPHPHTAHQQHLLSHALAAAAAHHHQQQQQQQQQQNSSSSGANSSGNNGGGSHLLSPPNSARTPTSASGWPSANQLFSSADFHSLGHLIQQTNSVTLSPAPSVSDGSGNSQGGSPSHAEQSAAAAAAAAALAAQAHINFYTQALAQAHNQAQAAANSAQAGSNSGSQSDSEENDSVQDNSPSRSPAPSTPIHLVPPPMSPLATTFSSAASSKSMDKDPLATTPLSDRGGGGDGLDSGSNGRLLWDFLQQLLNDPSQRYSHYIAWKNRETGVFKITDPAGLARLWGIQKNHPSMNYDKMSRALRYYYRVNILRKVQGERHCYQFLRNPIELKSIKNISLLRHQMAAAAAAAATTTTTSSATTATGSSGSSSTTSSGKMADSTDASLERYSPSSSCNAPDQDFDAEPRTSRFASNNNNEQDPEDNDCDMPTDLSMDSCERRGLNGTNPYLTTIKTENMAS
ncbi:ets DNA-binding protein pokkuri-like [Daphnia carinata]|uniref:ets DNA-binding protein pokkuri-like n=1 Tax=Daphnia carinata TaxID=120202 RepID=UPI00257CD1EA|nr:ets DNA-binding protein pokkuri-like [Daphnia carinata]